MSAKPGPGIKRLESEGLGLGGIDHFKQINVHAHAELLELVDEGNVDAAVDVLEQLGHLRGGGRGDGHGAVEDGAVNGRRQITRDGTASTDHFGDIAASTVSLPGSSRSGEKAI